MTPTDPAADGPDAVPPTGDVRPTGDTRPSTLWDRVEGVLKDNPVVVVLLLVFVALNGLKSLSDAVGVVTGYVQAYNERAHVWPCAMRRWFKSSIDVPGEETILFVLNDVPKTTTLSWVDNSGITQPYGVILANRQQAESTYAGHVWMLGDSATGCVGLVMMGSTQYIVTRKADGLEARALAATGRPSGH
jgi:hypothetical protein